MRTPGPLLAEVFGGLAQAHLPPAAALDAVQDLIDARPLREPAQFTGEELLQGLAASLCPALQGGVDVVGKVSYQQVRHAYIMLSFSLAGKSATRPADFVIAIAVGGLLSRSACGCLPVT